ncbi:MAG: hypothetical protein JSV03_07665, partial [Planctomycetota bacterium]
EAEAKVQTSSSTWQTPCPHCNAMKPSDADICSICGYDSKARRIRKKTNSVESGAVTSTAKVTKAVKTVGPIVRGCIFSGIGALLGGAAWFIIAILTEYELGIIAWAVGGLAGFGMHLGYGQPSGRAGIAAAGIAFLGIVAAKAMIFVFIVYSMIMAVVTGDTDNIEIQRAVLASFIANEILDERGIHSESEREAQWESVYKEADQRVAKMSDQEVRTKFKEYRDELVEAADPRTLRLASYYSNMRANQKGLAYDSQARETMYEEELGKYKSMSDDELDKAVSDLEAWESGGKWDDTEYVRTFLIYEHINEAIANMESEEEGEDITSQKWKQMYDQAMAEVDDISPAERLSRAKQIEMERERKIEEAMAKWKDQADISDSDADVGGVLGLFASSMFGFFDLVFMFLALGTAYRVASGGVGETE